MILDPNSESLGVGKLIKRRPFVRVLIKMGFPKTPDKNKKMFLEFCY